MAVYKRLWCLLFHLVVRGALPAFGRGDETMWLRSHILTIAPCVKAELYGLWMLGGWDLPEPTETIAEWSSQPGMSNFPSEDFPFVPAFRWPTWVAWPWCWGIYPCSKRLIMKSFYFDFSLWSPLETLVLWLEKIMKENSWVKFYLNMNGKQLLFLSLIVVIRVSQ